MSLVPVYHKIRTLQAKIFGINLERTTNIHDFRGNLANGLGGKYCKLSQQIWLQMSGCRA